MKPLSRKLVSNKILRLFLILPVVGVIGCSPRSLVDPISFVNEANELVFPNDEDEGSSEQTVMNGPLVGEENLDAEELEFSRLINEYRQQNGFVPLKISISLTKAASWMASDMATHNYLGHNDSLLRDAWTRISSFGYPSAGWGENCAAGGATAAAVLLQWKNSPGHNAGMLNPSFRVIGIGRAYNSQSNYKNYWATDFGSLVDATVD